MVEKNESLNLNISLREINEVLCPKCKIKLQEITKDKIVDELARRALEVDSERGKR